MHIMVILSTGRLAGPDFTRTPAVGGALYLLNGAPARTLCIIQQEFVNLGLNLHKYLRILQDDIRKYL